MRSPTSCTALGLLLALLCPGAVWSRIVRVPTGPLFRVAGTEVSIPCNVSDYEGPREQNFEWKFSNTGNTPLEVLSTWDPGFSNSLYKSRVRSNDIQLLRVSSSAVMLRIKQVTPSDEGAYICSTPSTDATYSGNYEDSVVLKVLPDTLKLNGKRGRQARVHNVTEGSSFQLQCQASSQDSSQHTHLSLSWEHQTAGSSPREVVSLTQLGRLHPGPGYEERYSSGEVRLDTVGADGFRLTLNNVLFSDEGEYSCVARTWVQGPEGWESIQEKRVDVSRVDVRPIGLSVAIPVKSEAVWSGDPMRLSCIVSHDSDGPVVVKVNWFYSPDLSSSPEETRELRPGHDPEPAHQGSGTHTLELAHTWDSGDYSCKATVWAAHSNGTWYVSAEKMSIPARIVVMSSVPEFEVSMNASLIPQFSQEPTELECHVIGSADARLSVSWYYTPSLPGDVPAVHSQLLGSLDQDWILQAGEAYKQQLANGDIIFLRKDPHTFVLLIRWTLEKDRGNYHCVVTSWQQQRNDSWVQSREVTSRPVMVFWEAEDPVLTVGAKLTRLVSAAGGTFEMRCGATARHIPSPKYSVQVTVDHTSGPVLVISLSHDGVIFREMGSRADTMLEKEEEGLYLFRLYRAQMQDVGAYRCAIAAWTQGGGGVWREVQRQISNPVQLGFQSSGLLFNITAMSDSPSVSRRERAEFWCIISFHGLAAEPEDLGFEVSWFAQRPGESPVLLAAVNRAAQVRQTRRNSSSEVALERMSDMEYRLRIYNCEEQDAGSYYCVVTPWVRSGEGGWNSQEGITSNVVSLRVRMDVLSAFKYPLIIGVGLALVVGLLSCLIGYCTSHFCCKTQPIKETRREHRRLMSMEMD
ncbi:prostaglandin F2 receptor negative regulator [Bombina bombina]|uniref:prostaglandin F2 receptor negative regulator n=1 Tax=Bombina bombina TaxID=8345 RepID=UPI00235AEF53|nr:prostaglandin F2 receptor negative regulator [Bombina bombina]